MITMGKGIFTNSTPPGGSGTCPRSPLHNATPIRQRGFSMFELIAYILVVSITTSVAYNRFADFPGAAERSNFMAVLMQIRAGTNLQMMNAIAEGRWLDLQSLEGSNPMDLMLETPVNYIGALRLVNPTDMQARIWYFDTNTGELVYIANDARNLYILTDDEAVQTDELRFRIAMKFRDEARSSWEGLVLEPVVPYVWESVELTVPDVIVE